MKVQATIPEGHRGDRRGAGGVGGFIKPRKAHAFYQSPGIPLFGTNLRGVGPAGSRSPRRIPTQAPGDRRDPLHDQHQPVHGPDRAGPTPLGPTTLWGYNPASAAGRRTSSPEAPRRDHRGAEGTADPDHVPEQAATSTEATILPVDTTIPGANQAQQPDCRPPPRRPGPLDQRRRPVRLV